MNILNFFKGSPKKQNLSLEDMEDEHVDLILLKDDFIKAIESFQSRRNMEISRLFPIIFQVFLTIPYHLFRTTGREDFFKEVIEEEVDIFLNSVKGSNVSTNY